LNQLTVRQVLSAPIFAVLFWILFASIGRTQDGGTWETRAPMPSEQWRRPTVASESAIIADLQAGNYIAVVRGVGNTTRVGLVEVYDLD
jgi:hypothetical protein